jgi:ABC-type dipeptide/oligopeptide/nickel transport system ATPase component
MRLIQFDRSQEIPIVDGLVFGPRKHERLRLVFDSGCGKTQIDTCVIESIGYSASDSIGVTVVKGPSGDTQEGYLVRVKDFQLFGRSFSNMEIGAHDFDQFAKYEIDGLLGVDVIKQLRF